MKRMIMESTCSALSTTAETEDAGNFPCQRPPPWRNRLARSAVNRKVGGSSPPGGAIVLFSRLKITFSTSHASLTDTDRGIALKTTFCSGSCLINICIPSRRSMNDALLVRFLKPFFIFQESFNYPPSSKSSWYCCTCEYRRLKWRTEYKYESKNSNIRIQQRTRADFSLRMLLMRATRKNIVIVSSCPP